MADTAQRAPKRLTVREFLEWEERQPLRYELVNGLVRMMAGGARNHNTVKGNIFAVLHAALRGKPCRPFDSDTKVPTAEGQSYYPDVVVDCGEAGGQSPQAAAPTVIFEVLSPPTREKDLDEKLPHYKATSSIREIIYVEPDRMHLMIWRRSADGWIEDEVVHPDAALALTSIGVSLPMSVIYEDVEAA